MSREKVLKILYNGSHVNKHSSKAVPQGGPSRFASTFRKYFLNQKDFSLCPLLFTHEDGAEPHLETSGKGNNLFFELKYEKELTRSIYNKKFTRGTLIKYLKPFIEEINKLILDEKPDVVFLNGFGMTNWILLYVAHKNSIPIVMQHAGIWKKEIRNSFNAFSPSVRKIFYDFERDTVRWCDYHIFLNKFSKNKFIELYKSTWTKNKKAKIIELPIGTKTIKKISKSKAYKNGDELNIGVVARWDSIKNHSAVLRLAKSKYKPKEWKINVVTKIPFISGFAKEYIKYVNIVPPMQPNKLEKFYDEMNIVLLMSRFDVSPTVVAESMLAGTPIVISDRVGWQDEFMSCGLEDHIVSTKISGKRLVNVINRVMLKRLDNERKYALLRSFINKNHSPSAVMKKYSEVFKLAVK